MTSAPMATKLDRGPCICRPRHRRLLKRQAARADRRAGKLMLDDAPKRRGYAGWFS